jgi:hypothetical protein
MSDGGKTHKPPEHSAPPARPAPEPQRPGLVPSAPISPTAEDRLSASLGERRQLAGELAYRATGGQKGTPPMARITGEARASTHAALARWARKASGSAGGPPASVPAAGGPLPTDLRAKLEPKLGASLSGVTVSTSGESAAAAAKLGARAFTVGQDIHFGAGQYDPSSKDGRKLIAHELTHTIQAGAAIQRKHDGGAEVHAGVEVSQPDDPAEKEADAVADAVTAETPEDQRHESAAREDGQAAGENGDAARKNPKAETGAETGSETNAAAPAIAAKLDGLGRKIFLAPNDPDFHKKVKAPADRHYFRNVVEGAYVDEKNTIIASSVDVNADVVAIQAGQAEAGNVSGAKTFTINGRTYGAHEDGRLYPMTGAGFTLVDRGTFKAIGVYKKFGVDTPRAEEILDRMKMTPDQRKLAVEVIGKG